MQNVTKKLIEQYYHAFNQGDMRTFLSFYYNLQDWLKQVKK